MMNAPSSIPVIAVLGGASRFNQAQVQAAYVCGREIAQRGMRLITGATTGIPYAAAIGAKEAGGFVIGVSPGASAREHVERYLRPLDHLDVVLYTGLGVGARSHLILQSAVGGVFIGGEFGTLEEFAGGCVAGEKVLGVIELGGICNSFRDLTKLCEQLWGTQLLFGTDPADVTARVCEQSRSRIYEENSKSLAAGQPVRELLEFHHDRRGT